MKNQFAPDLEEIRSFLDEYENAVLEDDLASSISDDEALQMIYRAESKLRSDIQSCVETAHGADRLFTVADLDKLVNEEETLREFIAGSEEEFNLPCAVLDSMSDAELNAYIRRIDNLWKMAMR